MLVCSVSLKAPRTGAAAIVADLAEAAVALDAPATGNVVFATLVDDPASVLEYVDAYLGEVMLEAASADTVLDGYFPVSYAADLTEAATAAETSNGTVTAAFTAAIWDPATVLLVTLSGGNLVATSTSSSTNQGAHVAAASGRTSGKYFFEITTTTVAGGGNTSLGVGTTASTYTNMGNSATTGVMVYTSNGAIWANGSSAGVNILGLASGIVVGIAIDLDNRTVWFRQGAGNWNASGTANPATNTGGITVPAGTVVPFCVFSASGNVFTANFGATSFAGAVPSGFTSGWPT